MTPEELQKLTEAALDAVDKAKTDLAQYCEDAKAAVAETRAAARDAQDIRDGAKPSKLTLAAFIVSVFALCCGGFSAWYASESASAARASAETAKAQTQLTVMLGFLTPIKTSLATLVTLPGISGSFSDYRNGGSKAQPGSAELAATHLMNAIIDANHLRTNETYKSLIDEKEWTSTLTFVCRTIADPELSGILDYFQLMFAGRAKDDASWTLLTQISNCT